MTTNNQDGFIAEFLVTVVGIALVVGFFWLLGCIRIEPSEQVVSGIVYNTTNDALISGNTNFSVRAGVDTYVNQSNESDFCLPPHSPYISLVDKAAANKNIKVVVTTQKMFKFVANPLVCANNVTVTEAK